MQIRPIIPIDAFESKTDHLATPRVRSVPEQLNLVDELILQSFTSPRQDCLGVCRGIL
jgi:hypothetical protein